MLPTGQVVPAEPVGAGNSEDDFLAPGGPIMLEDVYIGSPPILESQFIAVEMDSEDETQFEFYTPVKGFDF